MMGHRSRVADVWTLKGVERITAGYLICDSLFILIFAVGLMVSGWWVLEIVSHRLGSPMQLHLTCCI